METKKKLIFLKWSFFFCINVETPQKMKGNIFYNSVLKLNKLISWDCDYKRSNFNEFSFFLDVHIEEKKSSWRYNQRSVALIKLHSVCVNFYNFFLYLCKGKKWRDEARIQCIYWSWEIKQTPTSAYPFKIHEQTKNNKEKESKNEKLKSVLVRNFWNIQSYFRNSWPFFERVINILVSSHGLNESFLLQQFKTMTLLFIHSYFNKLWLTFLEHSWESFFHLILS